MDISSKVSLYDMFAMVIPGFLLLMLFSFCCNCQVIFDGDINSALVGAMIFLFSYVIGLIYHKSVECLFNKLGFRNNPESIKKEWDKFLKDGGIFKSDNFQPDRHEYYKAYYSLMRENMLNNIPVLEAQVVFIKNMLPITLLYIIVLCCYSCHSFWLNQLHINPCCLAILLFIIAIILTIMLIEIQNKIYYLVWEGNEYLNEIKK